MTLIKSIQAEIEAVVSVFCERLVEKHGLSKEEMMELWKETSEHALPVSLKKKTVHKSPRKESKYNLFVKTVNPLIRKEHPDWKFGEMSKETARRWKALSQEEKDGYVPPLPVDKEDIPQSPSPPQQQNDKIPSLPPLEQEEEIVREKLPKRPRVVKRRTTTTIL